MPETVFWDTAAFVALGNAKDNLHQTAVKMSRELGQAKAHVLTTDAVLTEVANTFSKIDWRPTAWQIIEAVQASVAMGMATIAQVDAEIWQRGWQLHRSRADKDWGLTDCISFVVMEEHNIRRAFTSDHHIILSEPGLFGC
ncbi:MAG: PIN domain-containing protein [Chloroflexi bacterium]|nr:MAG: PIN domain-containing protein [Chloroflexota bacterium]